MGSQLAIVALGGAVGSALRYASTIGMTRWLGTGFPFGTLLVNLVGCLLAGLIFGLAEERAFLSPLVRLLLLTGFLGGFTTFSTLALETVTLVRDGSWGIPLVSFFANNIGGLAFALAGIYVGRVVA
jgi:CrcB protein